MGGRNKALAAVVVVALAIAAALAIYSTRSKKSDVVNKLPGVVLRLEDLPGVSWNVMCEGKLAMELMETRPVGMEGAYNRIFISHDNCQQVWSSVWAFSSRDAAADYFAHSEKLCFICRDNWGTYSGASVGDESLWFALGVLGNIDSVSCAFRRGRFVAAVSYDSCQGTAPASEVARLAGVMDNRIKSLQAAA